MLRRVTDNPFALESPFPHNSKQSSSRIDSPHSYVRLRDDALNFSSYDSETQRELFWNKVCSKAWRINARELR